MEIKKEKKQNRRLSFLWLLLIVNIVLIIGVWQYHRVIVEVSDGAATGFLSQVFGGRDDGSTGALGKKAIRIALFRSEATAVSFGDNVEGYENLLELWRRYLDREGFGYETVETVPSGEDADRFNLLILPATRCMSEKDRDAVKAFLRSGKGVVMTWATGIRNEYGQWERFSLLHEIGGMDIVDPPPIREEGNVSTVLLSGGYPLTSSLYPGVSMNVTAYDEPLSCHVREDRVRVDGVWSNPDEPSYALHNVRDRAAVVHGNYLSGRFAWMGFTIGAAEPNSDSQVAFNSMLHNMILWAGHQVHAFKPAWPDGRMSMVSITQNIETPEDISAELLQMMRRYRVSMTSFVNPEVAREYPDLVQQLANIGEVGMLAPSADYNGQSLNEQKQLLSEGRHWIEKATGEPARGVRFPAGVEYGDRAINAVVRSGFLYISDSEFDRMVPKPIREYRPVPFVTRPRVLWHVPEMPYVSIRDDSGMANRNTMLAHYTQIISLGGYFCLSFRPSVADAELMNQLENLLTVIRRSGGQIDTISNVTKLWEGWDNIRIATRLLSPERASLKISNTGTKHVDDIVINVEMPYVQEELDLESMTLGTEMPDQISNSGVRWQLKLNRMGAGKNVVYYINVDRRLRGSRLRNSNELEVW